MIFSEKVDEELKKICMEISERYEIEFLEIGTDKDHVHFLVQSVPTYSPMAIIRTIKSITARELFTRCQEIKKQLWGGQLWSKGYYVDTVGKHGDEYKISVYVKNQGKEYFYKILHKQNERSKQKTLWD